MILPTEKQLESCEGWRWKYIGDGLFTRDGWVGWFTEKGFYKQTEEEFSNN